MVDGTYSLTHFFHLIGVRRIDSTLMVTKNGNLAIGVIIRLDHFSHAPGCAHLLEQVGHGIRSIISTEDLGSQTRHIIRKMFIESRCLRMLVFA